MGTMTKEATFALLDRFYEMGGNFIDTANNYQDGQSELWTGEWMAQHKNRDEVSPFIRFNQRGIEFPAFPFVLRIWNLTRLFVDGRC